MKTDLPLPPLGSPIIAMTRPSGRRCGPLRTGSGFEPGYPGDRGSIRRIDGDPRTRPLEPTTPAGDRTDHGDAAAPGIFKIGIAARGRLRPHAHARRARPAPPT